MIGRIHDGNESVEKDQRTHDDLKKEEQRSERHRDPVIAIQTRVLPTLVFVRMLSWGSVWNCAFVCVLVCVRVCTLVH